MGDSGVWRSVNMGDSGVWRSVNMGDRECGDPSIWVKDMWRSVNMAERHVQIRQYG